MSYSNHLIRGKNRSANEEGKLEKVISSPHHSRVRKEMDPSVENNTFFLRKDSRLLQALDAGLFLL